MALMGWRGNLVAAAGVAALVGGCGTTGHKTTTSVPQPTTSRPAPAQTSAVEKRTIGAGEFPGFNPSAPVTATTPQTWVQVDELEPSQRAAAAARFRRLHFVAGARNDLIWARSSAGNEFGGLSVVEQFASAADARSDLVAELPSLGPGRRFTVPGVPGASGVAGSEGASIGDDVLFTNGPYVYLVGAAWPAGVRSSPSRASLIAAVQHLYRRVRVRD